MEGQRFALALAFDTDLSEFVRGVEIGRLSEQPKTGEIVAQGVRTDNAEISCGWPRLLDVPCAARSQMTTGSTRLLSAGLKRRTGSSSPTLQAER